MQNPLLAAHTHGQSLWLDNLSRRILMDGTLEHLIEQDGISGITSNPAIFEKAISGSDTYDSQIKSLLKRNLGAQGIYEALAIQDIQNACDHLRTVFEAENGTDGFVSLEVNPHLANNTKGTLEEAQRLWKTVDRENLLIKIPGTPHGIPAVREALIRGINVNITLLFSLQAYDTVMEAHLSALEERLHRGQPATPVASVASFFLSRIDVKVDKLLEAKAGKEASALRGKAALASAKLAYQMWKTRYSGKRWEKLSSLGARVQKPLWASTSTKDPSYSDVKYVEPLIGPFTINTLPNETVEAFRDHGKVAATIEDHLPEARETMEKLKAMGIDMDRVTGELVEEGIEKFNRPFDALLASLKNKSAALASD